MWKLSLIRACSFGLFFQLGLMDLMAHLKQQQQHCCGNSVKVLEPPLTNQGLMVQNPEGHGEREIGTRSLGRGLDSLLFSPCLQTGQGFSVVSFPK